MDLTAGFLLAVGVTVALVPEGLLPTVTLSLARAAHTMAGRNALVRRLKSVETLGSTTVICTDKTGTLTANQMSVVRVWTPTGTASVHGPGYEPHGTVATDGAVEGAIAELASATARCAEGRAVLKDGHWAPLGDPMEVALHVLALRTGVDPQADEAARPERRRVSFDPARRRSLVVVSAADHEATVLVTGAPDAVLPLCPEDAAARSAAAEIEAMATRGLRVLGVAAGPLPTGIDPDSPTDVLERDLRLLGLVGLHKPFVERRQRRITSSCGNAHEIRIGHLSMPANVTEVRPDIRQGIRPEFAARQRVDGSEHLLCDANTLSPIRTRKRTSAPTSGEELWVLLLDGEAAVRGHAGGLVGEVERAVRVGDRFGEAQRRGHGPVGEHLLAAAEQQRVHPQVHPVDEAEAQQRLQEVEIADDVDFVMAPLEGGDALGEVVGDERRPLPGERASDRAAGNVLGDAVEQAGERDLLRSARPVVGKDLVGPSPEEQGVHAPSLLEYDPARLLVRQWRLPPAVREAAVAVLVGPSRRLCHSVERHELGHDEFAHWCAPCLVAMRS